MWPFKRREPVPSCQIDFDLTDDRIAIAHLLRRTIPFHSQSKRGLELDLTRVNYVGPFSAAVLLADELHSQNPGPAPIVRFPTNPDVRAFLHFSGLNHHFEHGPAPDANDPENFTVPLRVVQKATWNAPDPIIDLIHRHAALSEENETYLRNCVTEVIQNVEDHARSPFGAVYCASYFATPKTVRVAIVDRGLGIAATLSSRHPEVASAEEAIARVVKGGISAQSRPNNMGVGISNLWGHITNPLGGDIFIITEDALGYSDREGKLRTEPLGVRFRGTGVFFTVPVGG